MKRLILICLLFFVVSCSNYNKLQFKTAGKFMPSKSFGKHEKEIAREAQLFDSEVVIDYKEIVDAKTLNEEIGPTISVKEELLRTQVAKSPWGVLANLNSLVGTCFSQFKMTQDKFIRKGIKQKSKHRRVGWLLILTALTISVAALIVLFGDSIGAALSMWAIGIILLLLGAVIMFIKDKSEKRKNPTAKIWFLVGVGILFVFLIVGLLIGSAATALITGPALAAPVLYVSLLYYLTSLQKR